MEQWMMPEKESGVKLVHTWSKSEGWLRSGPSGNLVGRDM